ncbi:MAG: hypothetical protein WC499_04965 [Patescibacteria group bacterium]
MKKGLVNSALIMAIGIFGGLCYLATSMACSPDPNVAVGLRAQVIGIYRDANNVICVQTRVDNQTIQLQKGITYNIQFDGLNEYLRDFVK